MTFDQYQTVGFFNLMWNMYMQIMTPFQRYFGWVIMFTGLVKFVIWRPHKIFDPNQDESTYWTLWGTSLSCEISLEVSLLETNIMVLRFSQFDFRKWHLTPTKSERDISFNVRHLHTQYEIP